MNLRGLEAYKSILCVDFEFHPTDGVEGNPPDVVCLAAHDMCSGETIRLWRDELGPEPPYPIDDTALIVAYAAQAEMSCHLALGWDMPKNVLDLLVERRNIRNGLGQLGGFSLPRTMAAYGLDSISSEEKTGMRDLILGRGPWSDEQRLAILDYCQSDVDALARLLPAMLPAIDLPRALMRGEYTTAVAAMERNGIPVDVNRRWIFTPDRRAIETPLVDGLERVGDLSCVA